MTYSDYKITNIINYLRRSRQDVEREKRTGEDTLAIQKNIMDKVLNEFGVPFDQVFEIGSGDKIDTRPVFQEVLEGIKDGTYNAIAVKEVSRLGRGSYKDMGTIYEMFVDLKIYIITPHRIYYLGNESDCRQIRFELFMSREEFELTRERLVSAKYNLASEGKWVAGTRPYGFSYDKKAQKLIIDPEEAKMVQLIFDFYVNGIDDGKGGKKEVSFRAVATHLNRLGLKAPKGGKWTYTSITKLLTNTAYIGQITYRATKRKGNVQVERPIEEHIIVDNAHEKIIEMDVWEKAQEKYKNRGKTHNTKLDFSPSQLAGFVRCAKCGKNMIRNSSHQHYKKKNGEVTVYLKEFLWCNNECQAVKFRDVEEGILNYLTYLKDLDGERLQKALAETIVKKSNKNEVISVKQLRKSVEKKREDIKNRLKFIFEKYESGVYSDAEFLERKSVLNKEMEELDKVQLSEEEDTIIKEDDIDIAIVKFNMKSILDIYEKLDDRSNKNTVLREVFDHVVVNVTEKGRGRISAKFEMTPILSSAVLEEGNSFGVMR